jgi:hypothetical protein
MSERRCFRFAYLTPCHKDRERYPFQLRDGDAALCLLPALEEHGYRYAGPIFNYPSAGPDLIPLDVSFLRKTDLLLLTTRPPIHDSAVGDKKGIPRSYTMFEEKLFEGPLRERFERCARSEILLTNETAAISAEIAKRQAIVFRQNGGAMYQSYGSPITREWRRFKKPPPLTAAFLLYSEQAWPGGPALLAAFGMGGTETLVWCYQLATRFRHLLFTTPFAMAELRTEPLAERPTSIAFADSWEVTILGTAQPAPVRGPQRAA